MAILLALPSYFARSSSLPSPSMRHQTPIISFDCSLPSPKLSSPSSLDVCRSADFVAVNPSTGRRNQAPMLSVACSPSSPILSSQFSLAAPLTNGGGSLPSPVLSSSTFLTHCFRNDEVILGGNRASTEHVLLITDGSLQLRRNKPVAGAGALALSFSDFSFLMAKCYDIWPVLGSAVLHETEAMIRAFRDLRAWCNVCERVYVVTDNEEPRKLILKDRRNSKCSFFQFLKYNFFSSSRVRTCPSYQRNMSNQFP